MDEQGPHLLSTCGGILGASDLLKNLCHQSPELSPASWPAAQTSLELTKRKLGCCTERCRKHNNERKNKNMANSSKLQGKLIGVVEKSDVVDFVDHVPFGR